jgi:hypothetical protein
MDSPTPQPLGQFIVDSPPAAPPQQYYEAPAAAKTYKVVPISPEGNGNSGVLTALLIVLLVVAILYLAMHYQGGRSLGNALASCGWVLYIRPGCPLCTKQMDALGEDTYPRQVVCFGSAASASGTMSDSQGPYLCDKVPGFPFWVNEYTSATRSGLQDRKQLRQMLRSPGS